MVRSLSFVYLFVILAVSYIGGALLYRELPATSVEKMLALLDARVVDGDRVGWIWPALIMALFILLAYVLSLFKKSRFLVILIGALKSVLFGLSSSYLLASGMKMIEYTIWWFPFQFVTCFLFLVACAILSPPFFTQTLGKKKRNTKSLPIILILIGLVTTLEIVIYYVILDK